MTTSQQKLKKVRAEARVRAIGGFDVVPIEVETEAGDMVATVGLKLDGFDDMFALPPGSRWHELFGYGIQVGTVTDLMNLGFAPPAADEGDDEESEAAPRVQCSGCGRDLFGPRVEAGVCAACEPPAPEPRLETVP